MPEVSVVIPSYNHADFISEAVGSVLEQSLADLELIVVDDGSSDNSLEVLAGFTDPRMRVLAQNNQGAHAAINRGLSKARGKYLAILNSDDAYHPDRLAKLTALLDGDSTIGLAGSHIQVIDKEGKPLGIKHGFKDLSPWSLEQPERSFRAGDDLRAALLTENFLSTTSNFVFPREWFQRLGGFRTLRYAHDWDFALRLARQARLSLAPEPLVRYRLHGRNTIIEDQAAMIFEICWILAVHLPQSVGADWFEGQEAPTNIERLLHSIYTFDLDRVLNVMLLQRLDQNPSLALQLLELNDPLRTRYLEYIASQLNRRSTQTPAPSPDAITRLSKAAQKLASLIKGSR